MTPPSTTTREREDAMAWDRIEGNWKQLRGAVREQWGKLTDDDVEQIAGKRDRLVGKVQERYGIAKEEADRRIREWESRQQQPQS